METSKYPWGTPKGTPVDPKCGTCGIEFKGVWGYVCPRTDCPSQIRFTSTT